MRAVALSILIVACLAVVEAGRFRGAPAGDLKGPFEMIAHHNKGDVYGTKTAVYRSQVLPLAAGEVAFTDPATTFLTFPAGPIAISSFRAEVVDEFNASVPLYEVYNHHWIVMKNNGENNIGECNDLPYVFGVGEESRNTFVVYPYPYRLLATGTEKWTANIHIIRTVNVPHVKQCIECHCGDVNNPYNGGGFQCCGDKSVCPTDNNPHPPVKNYYLKYEIDYTEITPDLKPVDVYVFDASNCAVEYNIPPCQDPSSGCISTISKTYTLEYPADVIYAVGHVHVGSINITLEADNMQVPICVSRAHYGNGTTPGNENGYVVGLDSCTFNTPLHLPAGTTLRYTASYSSNPYHDSVMALFYMAVAHDESVPPFHRKPLRN